MTSRTEAAVRRIVREEMQPLPRQSVKAKPTKERPVELPFPVWMGFRLAEQATLQAYTAIRRALR